MRIRSFRSEYEVRFTEDIASEIEAGARADDFAIIDAKVARLHEGRIAPVLRGGRYLLVEASESLKSYEGLEPILSRLIRENIRKKSRLIAIGGGIIQDATAFIASVLHRGMTWMHVPTTLLAQGDSCIGSKTSINFGAYKNQLGTFWPPGSVLIDPGFLTSLPPEEIRSGLGEMMHYYFVSGRADFERIRKDYAAARASPAVMRALIERSLEIKKAVVEQDEFDEGPRRLFNYGHSFGHALEGASGYKVPHGIAVSYGMDMANWSSVASGLLSRDEALEMREVLRMNWAAGDLPQLSVEEIVERLRKDKKNTDTRLRVIQSRGIGKMCVRDIDADEALKETLSACLEHYSAIRTGGPA